MGRKHQKRRKALPSNQPLPLKGREWRERLKREAEERERKDAQIVHRKRMKAKAGLKEIIETPLGMEAFYRDHPWLKPKEPARTRTYLIPAGTICSVCKDGSEVWREHVTKKSLCYNGYERHVEQDEAGYYEFLRDGWKILVLCGRVQIRESFSS